VDCFLSVLNLCHHLLPLLQYCHTLWAPNFQWCSTNVTIICLHTFKLLQECHKNLKEISRLFHCAAFHGPLTQQIHPVLMERATS
jgi:hypothetical protein